MQTTELRDVALRGLSTLLKVLSPSTENEGAVPYRASWRGLRLQQDRALGLLLACLGIVRLPEAMGNPLPANPPPRLSGWVRRVGAAGPVAIVLSFWPPLGGFVLLATLTKFGPWLRANEGLGLLTYFLGIGLLLGVSFVPTYSAAILAGWAFGFAMGWPLAMVTITLSSLLAYAIGRWIARDRVLEVIREKPQWNAIYQALLGEQSGRSALVVALLRVPPASPFALANFALAAARVPLAEYTVGTLIGIAPRTALATFAAAGLEQLRFKNVGGSWMVVAGIAATVVVCVILGLIANRALRGLTAAR